MCSGPRPVSPVLVACRSPLGWWVTVRRGPTTALVVKGSSSAFDPAKKSFYGANGSEELTGPGLLHLLTSPVRPPSRTDSEYECHCGVLGPSLHASTGRRRPTPLLSLLLQTGPTDLERPHSRYTLNTTPPATTEDLPPLRSGDGSFRRTRTWLSLRSRRPAS